MNHFNPKSAAERYAKGRPDFHSNTIRHIRAFLQLKDKLPKALDIACGTGLSTKALLELATEVYGTDLSQEMLNLALEKNKIKYALAPAEQQPFPDNSFDLITVSSGVHWFAIDAFLAEAFRLLKSNAWLILFENHFIAEMEGDENFKRWFPERYLKKFPSPPRHNVYPWTNENLHTRYFNLVAEEKFTNAVMFNKPQLILYFTTQSNILSAVEKKATSFEEAEQWLNEELSPFFTSDTTVRTLQFGNWIKYIQRMN
jgi:ubiquinone/menaquinone biosynthesis C-methylase UbiE